MTPLQKSDGIVAQHRAKFDAGMKRARTLRELPRNLDYRATELMKVVDELAALVAPVASCKNCHSGHCCYQALIISDWEAVQIAKFSNRKMHDADNYVLGSRQKLVDEYTGIPCPFLKEGQCSVYPVRPIMCRLHFNMDDDMTICDIIGKPNCAVPYFNFQPLEFAVAQLFLESGSKYAELRKFFPDN